MPNYVSFTNAIGLKAVLLHNENQFPSVPLAYATEMKETYGTMEKILRLINYKKHQWQVVSDLKVLTILFGMQGGYTKFPCYLCEWDSRGAYPYKRNNWPSRHLFQIGKKNVVNIPLVQAEKIILPPLHLKLGFMKQFVKGLDRDSEAFLHLKYIFPRLSDAKIKEGTYYVDTTICVFFRIERYSYVCTYSYDFVICRNFYWATNSKSDD